MSRTLSSILFGLVLLCTAHGQGLVAVELVPAETPLVLRPDQGRWVFVSRLQSPCAPLCDQIEIYDHVLGGAWSLVDALPVDSVTRAQELDGPALVVGRSTESGPHFEPEIQLWREGATGYALEQTLDPFFVYSKFGVGPQRTAIQGDLLVVAAPFDMTDGCSLWPYMVCPNGAIYVFERDGGAQPWTLIQKLSTPANALDFFGDAVSLDGDRLITTVNLTDVHVYERTDATSPFQLVQVEPGIAGDAQLCLAGNRFASSTGTEVFVYEENAGVWQEAARLTADAGQLAHQLQDPKGFFHTLTFDGEGLLIRASIYDGASFVEGYVLHATRATDGTWHSSGRITFVDAATPSWKSFSATALGPDHAWLAAPLEPGGADWTALAVIERGGHPTYCLAKPTSSGCLPRIDSLVTASSQGLEGWTAYAVDLESSKAGLFFYGHSGRAAIPFQGGTLCVLPPLRRTPVQSSGGSLAGGDCTGTFALDLLAWAASGSDPLLGPGAVIHGQFWFRDPLQPDGTGAGLTDAVELRW